MFTIDALTTAFIGNFLSIVLLLMVLFTSPWALFHKKEYRMLLSVVFITLGCSFIDPIMYVIDGRGAFITKVFIYVGNSYLYFANAATGYLWVKFMAKHMNLPLSTANKVFMRILLAICSIATLLNVFFPIVFKVGEDNIYHRTGTFFLFVVCTLIYILDSVIVYVKAREASGKLKTFPIWAFILPILVAILVQSLYYGVSVIWPCVAIAIAGVSTSLQNEVIFRDSLTGLYNRYYLDSIKAIMSKQTDKYVTGIMADINSFKQINDTFGHTAGDDALIVVADAFKKAVGDIGVVIRYAGDEFIIFLNTTDELISNACVKRIHSELEKINSQKKYPFSISVSTGRSLIDIKNQSFNEFLNMIDKKMYADKERFYSQNPGFERRRNG